MNSAWILLAALAAPPAAAQTGVYAYVPARNGFLKLKSCRVQTTLIGPIVRSSTDFVYANPLPATPEVSFNFELPQAATLGGFGIFSSARFVPGRIQVKTEGRPAPETGLRRTAQVDEPSPTVYRCEITPPTDGSDIRIRLWTDAMVQPARDRMDVPRPEVDAPFVRNSPNWTIRAIPPARVGFDGCQDQYSMLGGGAMNAVAQRFSDGRYYVAGYLHALDAQAPKIEIRHAYYEAKDRTGSGEDVTPQVSNWAQIGTYFVWASDAAFGDPCQGQQKQLRVIATIDGKERTLITPENETLNLLEQGPSPHFLGLRQARTVFEDVGTVAFFGWTSDIGTVAIRFQGRTYATRPVIVPSGADAARLWAHQMIATNSIRDPERVLAMSLEYGILSPVTEIASVGNAEPIPTIKARLPLP